MLASNRATNILLVLVLAVGITIASMLATGVRGGPLDPPGPPSPTQPQLIFNPTGPCPTAPVIISAPGSYRLAQNITNLCGNEGFHITSPNVTLDLAGFTLTDGLHVPGNSCSGGCRGIEVFGGTLAGDLDFRGATEGSVHDVRLSLATGHLLGSHNRLSDCYVSGTVDAASYDTIENCTFTDSTIFGAVSLDGFSVLRDSRIKIDHDVSAVSVGGVLNGVYDNSIQCEYTGNSAGIFLSTSNSAVVRGNHVGSCNLGIELYTANVANTIEDNVVVANGTGIYAAANPTTTQVNVIRSNVATANASGTNNYNVSPTGNDVGPIGSAASSTNPNANISN